MSLSNEQIDRYNRNILLENVGEAGQEKLLAARVLIIGTGGLGSPIALYLAAAGVGTLGLADSDSVDLSNLQRQIIHHTSDVGVAKVESARRKIEQLNPDVTVVEINERVCTENVMDMIADYDFIIEGTDNFATKFLVNDACILADRPLSQAGILRFKGQTMTHVPGSASYRCVYRQPPSPKAVPPSSEVGVLGAIAGTVGTIQATEALKYILDIGDMLVNRILVFDALSLSFRIVKVKPTEWGAVAAENTRITKLTAYEDDVCGLAGGGQPARGGVETVQT